MNPAQRCKVLKYFPSISLSRPQRGRCGPVHSSPSITRRIAGHRLGLAGDLFPVKPKLVCKVWLFGHKPMGVPLSSRSSIPVISILSLAIRNEDFGPPLRQPV